MNNKEESRELPWYIGAPEPTPQIIRKIVVKFPFYVSIRPEISCYYATFYKCRDIVKAYFTQAKSSKMQQIAEEAWKLVDQLVSLFEMGKNLDLNCWNVLNSKWDTVIRKFDMCMVSGEQQEKPAETGKNAVLAKVRKLWNLVRRIPRWIYVLVLFLAALLTSLHLLGWLEPIKDFIAKILWPK